jgi:hypothetical protein
MPAIPAYPAMYRCGPSAVGLTHVVYRPRRSHMLQQPSPCPAPIVGHVAVTCSRPAFCFGTFRQTPVLQLSVRHAAAEFAARLCGDCRIVPLLIRARGCA